MSDYTWTPSVERVANANVTRLAQSHGIDSLDELRARSRKEPEWYWDAAIGDLGIRSRRRTLRFSIS